MKKDGVELNTKKQGYFLRIKHYMVEKYRYWAILGEETSVVSLPKFVFSVVGVFERVTQLIFMPSLLDETSVH